MEAIYNPLSSKDFRKTLRKNPTEPEKRLWQYLRKDQIHGYKFRRQFGVDKYVLDFYAPKLNLAIELDGDSHYGQTNIKYDILRTKYLEKLGIDVLRFTNLDIMQNIGGVVQEILKRVELRHLQTPPSLP